MDKKRIIGVDLDSTLIMMTVCGKAAKELGYDYTDVDVIDWYQSNFPEDMKKRMFEMFVDPEIMCEHVSPIEGSQETISKWSEQGHKIVLITARGPALHQDTVKMIRRLYPEIHDVNFVNFNESKMDIIQHKGVEIWVDDAPHGVIDALSLHVPTIMVSNKFTKYNWKVRHHPRLYGNVKKIQDITDQQIKNAISPWTN